ncbi:MAG: ThiF family adenylyltransferase [Gemmatimonadaceae bacterium]|nr:ThiF family adenylyltransferase [Gemmatimonadaceae bacterium]
MARSAELIARRDQPIVLRFAHGEMQQMRELVFRRYPNLEWATFAWFGWRETDAGEGGGLIITLASIEPPGPGDLDETVGHVAIDAEYSLRIALAAEKGKLAPAVVHSHPRNCAPVASTIDDDMDCYYGRYFADFAPGRPYISLIFSEIGGRFVVSGRILWRGEWHMVSTAYEDARALEVWRGYPRTARSGSEPPRSRTARLQSAFGEEATRRLRDATVAVIGAGGTGSAAIEVLARAGVGRLVIVDPDDLEESNLERVHGSTPEAATRRLAKVVVARDHVHSIDPSCEVIGVYGALPQSEVIDLVTGANVLVCCTDSHSSRLAISDLSVRYLLPAIDCAVTLEGSAGRVRGQIMQFVRFLPKDPCALCHEMTIPWRVAQELMSDEEKQQRRAAANDAAVRGEAGEGYWRDVPQLDTVGYLTTSAGALVAGYAIGWITGRFEPPFTRLQMNLVAPFFDVTDAMIEPRRDCSCTQVRGWADQASADAYVSAPSHWPPPVLL